MHPPGPRKANLTSKDKERDLDTHQCTDPWRGRNDPTYTNPHWPACTYPRPLTHMVEIEGRGARLPCLSSAPLSKGVCPRLDRPSGR